MDHHRNRRINYIDRPKIFFYLGMSRIMSGGNTDTLEDAQPWDWAKAGE